jgi:hypothetical protein
MIRSATLLLTIAATSFVLGDAPPDSRSLDSDPIIVRHPIPAISPDGQWVAYVSRGFVCIVPADATAPPRRLMEVPDCESHLLARPENERAKGDLYALIGKDQPRDEWVKSARAVREKITATVLDLRWTPDSETLVWGVHRTDAARGSGITEFWASSTGGNPRQLCRIERGDALGEGVGRGYLVGHDLRYLVCPELGRSHRPLIWDVSANRPRATPYLHLTPSESSDRWIGVEKDTQQLVVTDADFNVRRRYEVYRDSRSFGFELLWSPDERYILWRNQIGFDHYSNWEGFAMDLETGDKLDLSGQYMREDFGFTGRGGEFFRSGMEGKRSRFYSGTEVTGAALRLYPSLSEEPRELWARDADPQTRNSLGHWGSPAHVSCEGRHFAVCLPRDDASKPGCRWRLIDRSGELGPMLGTDNGDFESPCKIAGFADGDRVLVGYTSLALFAIPIGPAPAE